MRFCMITTFYPPYSFGGDGLLVRALSEMLTRNGHQVEVIHCADSYRALGGKEPPHQASSEHPIRVHTLRSNFGILSPMATQQTGYPIFKTEKIEGILTAGKFDVIHFHNISLAGGPAVLRMGQAVKIYTLHEHWLLCPMHTLFRDNVEPCREKRCVRCALHYRRPPQLWRYTDLLREAVGHIDAFIAPTEYTRSLHLDSGLPMKVVTIPNFHDPGELEEAESPAPAHHSPERPFFLYAGRLERAKGVHTLLPAFQQPGAADLVIAGDGSESRALRKEAGGFMNIRFLGRLQRPQLATLYRNALAVLVPSLATEVFPLVVLEAFAARTPVIARAHGPLPEIVNSSGGGLLFQQESELPGLLDRLRSRPDLRNSLGDAGYETWLTRWSAETHLNSYLSLIAGLRQ